MSSQNDMTFQMNDQGKRQDLTLTRDLTLMTRMTEYLALLGCDLPVALGSNLRSEILWEGQ